MTDHGMPAGALFAARAMLSALQRCTRMLRREPHGSQCTAAVREFVQRARAAVADTVLLLELRGHEVFLGSAAVHASAPDDGLTTQLSSLGVGGIRFEPAVTDAELRELAAILASESGPCGAPENDVVARFQIADLRHISLMPASASPGNAAQRTAEPWSVLPRSPRPLPVHQAAVDRELEANLPAQAAQLLLQPSGPQVPGASAVLARLLQAMLDRGDAASAAWLLGQAPAALDAAGVRVLQHTADERLSAAWTAACIDGGPRQVQGLAALALELGEDAVARCLAAEALLGLPEAERYLATMIASAPEAVARAVEAVDELLLPALLRAIARAGAPLPVPATARRLREAAGATLAAVAAVLRTLPPASPAYGELQELLAAALAGQRPR